MTPDNDTIVAPATAPGGALAVIRLAGPGAIAVADRLFCGRQPLAGRGGGCVCYGAIRDFAAPDAPLVDEVVVTLFRAPHSYTGEDTVEFSCHGSPYVVSEVLRLALVAGARMADPGEFTRRAYLNGKLDLSQAEAVADLIAASSRAAHTLATQQLRGGYSTALDALREELVQLAALLELELDFGEEEVAFADRATLLETIDRIDAETARLCRSFALGNALKEGVAVAIVGAPNVGKSTLLNRLLEEERALVSEIAGTTRDVIEERLTIDGVAFRILDTAGIRRTEDRLERMGIERTLQTIGRAQIVVHMVDAAALAADGTPPQPDFDLRPDQRLLTVINKIDTLPPDRQARLTAAASAACVDEARQADRPLSALTGPGAACSAGRCAQVDAASRTDRPLSEPAGASECPLFLSARSGEGVEALRKALRAAVPTGMLEEGSAIVSSVRHYEALTTARAALSRAREGLVSDLPTDLLSEEIRCVTSSLASITGRGAILPDELLGHIFSRFCIGK